MYYFRACRAVAECMASHFVAQPAQWGFGSTIIANKFCGSTASREQPAAGHTVPVGRKNRHDTLRVVISEVMHGPCLVKLMHAFHDLSVIL